MEYVINKHLDTEKIKKVLDYGGDAGQYIPDCFAQAEKFVYEISNVPTIDGVKNISNEEIIKISDFDFVMCLHVLEHVANPIEIVKKLCSYCKKDGYIYIEVPVDRAPFDNDTIYEHINIFSDRTFLSFWDIEDDITLIDVNTCFCKRYVLMQKKKSAPAVKFLKRTVMDLKIKIQTTLQKHENIMKFITFVQNTVTKYSTRIRNSFKNINTINKKVRVAYLLTKQNGKDDADFNIDKISLSLDNSAKDNMNINVLNLSEEEFQDEFLNLEYLKKYQFDKTLEILKQKLKDKKVIFYGGGSFFHVIKKYYNLVDINAIGIADKCLSQKSSAKDLYGFKIYKPEDIKDLRPDYVVISTKKVIPVAEELYFKYLKNTDIKIIPLVRKGFLSTYKDG